MAFDFLALPSLLAPYGPGKVMLDACVSATPKNSSNAGGAHPHIVLIT
jgi:hypothetical protein